MFSTLTDQSELGLSQLKATSPKKGKSQLSSKSLFTSSIGHSDSRVIVDSGTSFREPIVSAVGTNSETNSPVPVLEEVLIDTMATSTVGPRMILGLGPAPIPLARPDVPIAI